MEWITKTELEKMKKFLAVQGERILFYHRDCDGVCSAALWLRFFQDFERFPREGPWMGKGFVKWVIDQDPDLLVFLDLPIDQEWKRVEKMLDSLPDVRILVIDHHIVEKDLNSDRVLHINPKFKEDIYLPASYLVYRITEKLGKDVGGVVWLAALGIAGDYGFEDCRDFLRESRIRREDLEHGSGLVSAAISLKGSRGVDKVLNILLKTKSYEDFLDTKILNLWKRYVDEELERVIGDFDDEKEEYAEAGLVIYMIKSKLNLVSVVATHFSEKLPDKVVMIGKKSRDKWKISVRNQSGKVNVGEIVKRCAKNLGSGGGHKKAAGGLITDFEKFKKRFINELKGMIGR